MSRRRPLYAHLHKLHGVRLKINRAKAHADALDHEVVAWFQNHPYGVVGQYDPGPPEQYVFKVRFLEHVPPSWAVILGDFVHNARSALEHLAYLVVLENNGGKHERTQFPIVLVPWDWPRQAKKGIGNASQRHTEIIESFQPYHRRDPQGWHTIWSAIDDPFAILNRLSNVDKHSVLNATPAAVESIGWDFEIVRDVTSIESSSAKLNVLVDDEELVRAYIVSNGPHPELKLKRTEHVQIAVQYRVDLTKDEYTLRQVPLKDSMEEILSRLGEIFEVFVHEFG